MQEMMVVRSSRVETTTVIPITVTTLTPGPASGTWSLGWGQQ